MPQQKQGDEADAEYRADDQRSQMRQRRWDDGPGTESAIVGHAIFPMFVASRARRRRNSSSADASALAMCFLRSSRGRAPREG
jgi:hypothetical protein